MLETLKSTGGWLLQKMCPDRCIGCERAIERREPVCEACRPLVRQVRGPACPTCALPRPRVGARPASGVDAPCRDCRHRIRPQRDAHARWLYEPVVASAIQGAKYHGERWRLRALTAPMADWLAGLADDDELDATRGDSEAPPLVTAVPMHPAELRDRGYNTAIQVARRATRGLEVEHRWEIIAKHRVTRPQAGLSRAERLENVTDAFHAPAPDYLEGRDCLLFDDVVTTGTTISEVAGVLDEAGARTISIVAAARAPAERSR